MPPKKKAKQQTRKQGKLVTVFNLSQIQSQCLNILRKKLNLNGFRWEVVNGLYLECNLPAIFEATIELNINHLTLNNNLHHSIIPQITPFNHYQKYLKANTDNNKITTIEGLAELNAPVLWRIELNENCITSIRIMRKISFPNLVMFRIQGNHLRQINEITECYLPKLCDFIVNDNMSLSNIIPLIKLQSNQFNQVIAYQTCFIGSKPIMQQIHKRFLSMYIKIPNQT